MTTDRIRRASPRALVLALAGLALCAATACKGGDGPDCKAVGAAYASLQRNEIEKPAAAGGSAAAKQQREQALSLIPLVKETMVKECQDKKWNAETRRCVVAAKSPDDLERCRTRPEEKEGEAEPVEAPAKAPAPAEPVPAEKAP